MSSEEYRQDENGDVSTAETRERSRRAEQRFILWLMLCLSVTTVIIFLANLYKVNKSKEMPSPFYLSITKGTSGPEVYEVSIDWEQSIPSLAEEPHVFLGGNLLPTNLTLDQEAGSKIKIPLTVKIPPGILPGRYQGSISVRSGSDKDRDYKPRIEFSVLVPDLLQTWYLFRDWSICLWIVLIILYPLMLYNYPPASGGLHVSYLIDSISGSDYVSFKRKPWHYLFPWRRNVIYLDRILARQKWGEKTVNVLPHIEMEFQRWGLRDVKKWLYVDDYDRRVKIVRAQVINEHLAAEAVSYAGQFRLLKGDANESWIVVQSISDTKSKKEYIAFKYAG